MPEQQHLHSLMGRSAALGLPFPKTPSREQQLGERLAFRLPRFRSFTMEGQQCAYAILSPSFFRHWAWLFAQSSVLPPT